MLSKTDENKLKAIRKLTGCDLDDCGKHIELKIDEQTDKLNASKKVYAGSCEKCGKRFKLKHMHLLPLKRFLGQPKVTIVPTTYNSLFTENE